MAASNSDESAAASWTASASFSGSSSTAVGAVKRTSSQADANCTCGASTTKRSCLACLNEMLLSGDECAINPYGTCVTKDEAERAQTALQNALSASRDVPGSLAIYASANASYCGSDDQVCSACRATWISEYELGSLGIATALGRGNGTALSCTGADGCVCLAYCELREMYVLTQFEAAGFVTTCRVPSPLPVGGVSPTPGPDSSTTYVALNNRVSGLDIVIYMFIGGIVAVVLTQITRCISNRCKPIDPLRVQASDWTLRRRRRPPLVRSEPRFGPLLALSGWVAFRERLIEDEREQLELREDEQGEANKQTPTPTLSAAAPRIAVEIGEGFRPESPSQLHRQQPPAAPQ